jgi:hypothetical protein
VLTLLPPIFTSQTIKFNGTQQMDKATILNILSVSILVLAPLLRSVGVSFQVVGNTLVRLGLLAYIVYASYVSVFSGLLAFLAAFSLLLERNHGILTGFPEVRAEIPMQTYRTDEVPVGVPSVVEREPEMDDDNAENLEDNNPRIKSVPRGASSATFYTNNRLV